jgi:uncharacterized flavoprotein (TIGR03862 family)
MSDSKRPDSPVVVIGAGPAGLMAAEVLARAGMAVQIMDAMPSPGRKFLMAGRGGLNLTHSEPLDRFIGRYGVASPWMGPLIQRFPPQALRDWCEGLGISTFTGSSGRVFPDSFKASILLRAWLRRLDGMGVVLNRGWRWGGWHADGSLLFTDPTGARQAVSAAATILALGGASWPRLGSDGSWAALLARHDISLAGFQPSNCGVVCGWSETFRQKAAGLPLKRIALSMDGVRSRGELVITDQGLEGGALYALTPGLRRALAEGRDDGLMLDLQPDRSVEQVAALLGRLSTSDSLSNRLRKALSLGPPVATLLRELAPPAAVVSASALATAIKGLPVPVRALQGLERAISSAGGVCLDQLDDRLMLRRLPGLFCCGEMLDWEAPTGGYLLQGCFATGVAAGQGALDWLAEQSAR